MSISRFADPKNFPLTTFTRSVLALAVAATLGLDSTALGLPGDPLPVPLTPAEGATLVSDPAGTRVTFECPPYRRAGGETATAYGVSYARTPTLVRNGVLENGPALATVESPGRCSLVITPRTGIGQPGLHYWMPSRELGDGRIETGPIRSFRLRLVGTASLVAPPRAYAGYLFRVRASFTGLPVGTPFRLQRLRKGAWVRISGGTLFGDGTTSEMFAKLPEGTQKLRISAGPVVSPTTTIKVIRAREWSTRNSSGSYRGTGRGPIGMRLRTVRFLVSPGGRFIRSLLVVADVPCPTGPGVPNPPTLPSTARRALVRVAPNGRFISIGAQKGQPFLDIRGRIVGDRVAGRIVTGFAECGGIASFIAHRVPRSPQS